MKNKISNIIKISLGVFFIIFHTSSYSIEFNTDVVDSSDKDNIDFSRFSQAGYIMPGVYQLQIVVNGEKVSIGEIPISFFELREGSGSELSQPCITQEIFDKLGLTEEAKNKVKWNSNSKCASLQTLAGVTIKPDLAEGVINIIIPKFLLEYSDASWLPPSRWEDGIPGLLVDYNINGNVMRPKESRESRTLGYNGTVGANIDSWRVRADYQGTINNTAGERGGTQKSTDWTRFYLYRALPKIQSKLTAGENYVNSDIFSGWSYTGILLESDDRMLPPRLRGYAPRISGIASTNARVIVKQKDRILYDSTVPAGQFEIDDLDSAVRGRLDVEVIESNGAKKTFEVNTAYVPYLTRPGRVRYKLIGGKSRYMHHQTEGPAFSGGELSWGIDNLWSVYGGGIVSDSYNSLALGLGRDLSQWGTLSADVTQSFARLPGKETLMGKSWRMSYSKRFDDANTDITFAGYRFSERNYMTMSGFLDARYRDGIVEHDKELYTFSVNKYFNEQNMSIDLQYSHQTYWDRRKSDYYTINLNQYMDILGIKNISLGVSASRTRYLGRDDDTGYLRISIPFGDGTFSYNSSVNRSRTTNTVGYSETLNGGLDSYSINTGVNRRDGDYQGLLNGYYSKHSPIADISASFASVQNQYNSFGFTASGGATFTGVGAALHSGGVNGNTRMLISTDGVSGVPVDGGRVYTNQWGTGVITDISSYYRNTVTVDLKNLPDDVEAPHSVTEASLTEGAIGYRKFEVLKGLRVFAVLGLADKGHPPFGASVLNDKGRELGMVADDGLVWLSGVKNNEKLSVSWNGKEQCKIEIPDNIKSESQLLLPCQ